jgi:hypothetical protein
VAKERLEARGAGAVGEGNTVIPNQPGDAAHCRASSICVE